MKRNTWRAVAAALGIVATAAVAAAVIERTNGVNSVTSTFRGSVPPGRNVLPNFRLRSYGGQLVEAKALRGRVVVLTILDAQCEESCPAIAWVVARTVDRLTRSERRDVRAIAISGDPAEDTPAAVRRFLLERRALGRMEYLIGDVPTLRPVWRALHVLPSLDSGSDDLHSAPVRVYDTSGVWVATLHAGADLSIPNLLHDIRLALRARTGR